MINRSCHADSKFYSLFVSLSRTVLLGSLSVLERKIIYFRRFRRRCERFADLPANICRSRCTEMYHESTISVRLNGSLHRQPLNTYTNTFTHVSNFLFIKKVFDHHVMRLAMQNGKLLTISSLSMIVSEISTASKNRNKM